MNALADLTHLIVSTMVGFYLGVLWLRFLLQYLRADFYNPVAQWVERLTRPVLQPLRKLLPAHHRIDWASLLLIGLLKCAELSLYTVVEAHALLPVGQLLFYALYSLTAQLLYFYQGVLILLMIMSWVVAAGGFHPLYALLLEISEPLCAPARKILPPMGGIDFSLMLVFFAIQIADMLVQHLFAALGAVL